MLSQELITAIERGDFPTFNQLLQTNKAQVNEVDDKGLSLLMHAIINHKLPFIEALIVAGADVNKPKQSRPYSTPIAIAAHLGDLDAVTFLLAHGADVNLANTARNTPLTAAVAHGDARVVKVLIAAGANVNVVGCGDLSPIIDAAYSGHTEIVDLLVAAGANRKEAEIIPVSQEIILKKINEYIAFEAERSPERYHSEDASRIAKEIENGQCAGFSALWLYYQKKYGSDEVFFERLQKIAKWDGLTLSKELETDFEALINEVFWLQQRDVVTKPEEYATNFSLTGVEQVNLDVLFATIADEKLQHEFNFSFVVRPGEVAQVLDQVIFDEKMVQIGGLKHGVAVMKKEGQYFLYDSNSIGHAKIYQDINALADGVVHALQGIKEPGNIDLTINSFDVNGALIPSYPKFSTTMQQLIELRKKEGLTTPVVVQDGAAQIISMVLLLYRKDLADIQALIEAEKLGTTAILEAIKYNMIDIIPELVKQGADLNQVRVSDGYTPIYVAVINQNKDAFDALLTAKVNINPGLAPIIPAAMYGNSYMVNALIKAGADTSGLGILLSNIINDGFYDTAKILITAGIELNSYSISFKPGQSQQDTPLTMAINKRQKDLVYLLIEKADLNKPMTDGSTPLMCAIMSNQVEIALALIVKGVEVNTQDKSGLTALQMAKSKGEQSLIDKLEAAGAVEMPKPHMRWQLPMVNKLSSSSSATNNGVDVTLGDLPPSLSSIDGKKI